MKSILHKSTFLKGICSALISLEWFRKFDYYNCSLIGLFWISVYGSYRRWDYLTSPMIYVQAVAFETRSILVVLLKFKLISSFRYFCKLPKDVIVALGATYCWFLFPTLLFKFICWLLPVMLLPSLPLEIVCLNDPAGL